jgi:hypothetical protein
LSRLVSESTSYSYLTEWLLPQPISLDSAKLMVVLGIEWPTVSVEKSGDFEPGVKEGR